MSLDSTWAVSEEQIAIVEDAKSHSKNRRDRRQLVFWLRQTRDFEACGAVRSREIRAKRKGESFFRATRG